MDKSLARFLVTLFSISWLIPVWLMVVKIRYHIYGEENILLFLVWFGAVLAFWVWRLYPLIGDRRESALPADPARGEPPLAQSPQEPKA